MGQRDRFQGGCVGGRLTTKPTELQRRPYLCQREVTPSILLLNTDHLCCYLPCCQIPGRCSPGLWSGHLRDSLSERRLHKEPIQRSENRKQPHNVLPQAACFDLASATCPGHETWDEFLNFYRTADNFRGLGEKRGGGRGGNTLFPLRVKNNEASFLPMFSSSCYKLKATRTST